MIDTAAKRAMAAMFDAVGSACFDCRTPEAAARVSPKNLLLVRLDHLGDVVCMLPLIERIAALPKKPRLTILTSSSGARLL